MTEKQQLIGVLDCNNFFVSCERLFRPDLLRRPVIVLSSNDGCVVARSQEIKDIGIPMGVPYFQLKDMLKDYDVEVFSSNFALYRDISRRVFEVVREAVSNFEPYSIDEGFFLINGEDGEAQAKELRERVATRIGMPVSIGIARSKTLAKYANSIAKKTTGVHLLLEREWQRKVATVKLGEVWGVGGQRSRAFATHGLATVDDLLRADRSRIARLFGVEGLRLRAELGGEAVYRVETTQHPQKSIMSSRSFKASTHTLSVVLDAVAYHTRRAVEDLRKLGVGATKITVFIGSSRYEGVAPGRGVREIDLGVPSDDVFLLLRYAAQAVAELYDASVAYKRAGVLLSGLTAQSTVQPPLFATEALVSQSTERLRHTIAQVNERFGQDVLQVGSHLQESVWQARREALSPAYTTSWNELCIVRA